MLFVIESILHLFGDLLHKHRFIQQSDDPDHRILQPSCSRGRGLSAHQTADFGAPEVLPAWSEA